MITDDKRTNKWRFYKHFVHDTNIVLKTVLHRCEFAAIKFCTITFMAPVCMQSPMHTRIL